MSKTIAELRAEAERKKREAEEAEKIAREAEEKESGDIIEKAIKQIQDFKAFLTASHKMTLRNLIAKRTKKEGGRAKGEPMQPKFVVNGVTWVGRGRLPTEFEAWDKSDEGKKWHKEHPKQRYPFADGYNPTEEDLNWDPVAHEKMVKEARAKRQAKDAAAKASQTVTAKAAAAKATK